MRTPAGLRGFGGSRHTVSQKAGHSAQRGRSRPSSKRNRLASLPPCTARCACLAHLEQQAWWVPAPVLPVLRSLWQRGLASAEERRWRGWACGHGDLKPKLRVLLACPGGGGQRPRPTEPHRTQGPGLLAEGGLASRQPTHGHHLGLPMHFSYSALWAVDLPGSPWPCDLEGPVPLPALAPRPVVSKPPPVHPMKWAKGSLVPMLPLWP